ncbi:MAG: phosphatase [Solirubrobacterales bacterium]|nr:phosphatase [Solirubrobacterales bacterium]
MPPAFAILSDLDGTLVDSKASVDAAYRWWAELRGLPADTVDRVPHGRTSADAAALLAPHLDADEEGALLDRRQAEDTVGVVALPGACELLATHEPIAVVTSCRVPLARARLRAAGLPEPTVLITPELVRNGKPHPEPYLMGAERLGARPAECVVLEDAPAGVQAGIAAGMRVVALLTTHSRAELPGAEAYISSPRELGPALAELMG